jgi:hypothetical protein
MKKKDTNWFISEAIRIHGRQFDYSGSNYIDSKTKILIKCKKHNHFFDQKSNDHFKSIYPCKICLKEARNTALADGLEGFKLKLEKKFGLNFDLTQVNYVNARTKITITCKVCGNIMNSEPFTILNGKGCGNCYISKTKRRFSNLKLKEINQFVNQLGGKCLSNLYNNNEEQLKFVCRNAHIFFESWSDVKFSMRWCKECAPNRYVGETLVRMILEHYLETKLPSVYLPEMNGLQLDGYCSYRKIAFEYQGRQHIKVSKYFHTSEGQFEQQIERDREKRNLCAKNGIQLIEIQEFNSIKRAQLPLFENLVIQELVKLGIKFSSKPFELDWARLYQGRESTLYEQAKEIVLLENATIEEFIGSESKHAITCSVGHKFQRPLSVVIRTGASCPTCSELKKINDMASIVAIRGGKLHDNELKPNGLFEYYRWDCDKGHQNSSKGYYIMAGSWCKECQRLNMTRDIPFEKLKRIAEDNTLTSEQKANLLGISIGNYYSKLKKFSIINYSKEQDRTKQDVSGKSKGIVFQIDPETGSVVNTHSCLQAVKRHESGKFNPEGIRPVLNKFKMAYRYYWCREDYYQEFVNEIQKRRNGQDPTRT